MEYSLFVISKVLLIDKLRFDGLIMKNYEWAGNLPEIVITVVTRRPANKEFALVVGSTLNGAEDRIDGM